MGSPDFAVPTLDALHESGRYAPALVVSQPDRPRGRGQVRVPTPTRARAMDHEIPTAQMSKSNYDAIVEQIRDLAPDVVVVVAFGIIVKSDLLDLPPYGCINVHASLLPRYRGVSPIQAALLAGDRETGCTTMHMNEGVDTGGILLREATGIAPADTAGSLMDRLAGLGAQLLIRTLDGLFAGTLSAVEQEDSPTPYTRKIKKRHGRIDWTLSAAQLERSVRAMTPWPSAFTFAGGKRLIVLEASVGNPGGPTPGAILELDPLTVACGEGSLVLHRVKPEGRKSMSAAAFLTGHRFETGNRFGDEPDD